MKKEYEVHVSVSYTTDGGSKEYDCYLEYVDAENKREAKKIVRDTLKAEGKTVTHIEVIEA